MSSGSTLSSYSSFDAGTYETSSQSTDSGESICYANPSGELKKVFGERDAKSRMASILNRERQIQQLTAEYKKNIADVGETMRRMKKDRHTPYDLSPPRNRATAVSIQVELSQN